MVQLKVIEIFTDEGDVIIFQYLYGAVKRNVSLKNNLNTDIFQYLYGAVKSCLSVITSAPLSISIPIWCS
ncbi:hypothetical protein MODO_2622 [Myroides odoratimimus]|nr:hypothetical protein MODO_2622 [Myroides odoratimimus]